MGEPQFPILLPLCQPPVPQVFKSPLGQHQIGLNRSPPTVNSQQQTPFLHMDYKGHYVLVGYVRSALISY